MYIRDFKSNNRYLVDTGSSVSLLPVKSNQVHKLSPAYDLLAANGTAIATYGTKEVQVRISVNRSLTWSFIIADVKQAIIGIDFLKHHQFTIDARRHHLIHGPSSIIVKGCTSSRPAPRINHIQISPDFQRILEEEFPELVNLSVHPETNTQPIQHHIETTGSPVFARARRLSPEKLAAAKEAFNEMIAQEIIRPSKSAWASPIHLVPKGPPETATWRICGDYRQLNAITKPDRYPVPHCQDFHFKLHGKKIFSKVDLQKAFHQIPVHPDDIEKTAVITPFGLYEYPKMSFGLRNAAQTMQRLMDIVTRGLDFVTVYIDDILIASNSREEHIQHLRQLFERLRSHGLKIHPAKSLLGVSTLDFLGHKVSAEGISPLPQKVQAITEFPKPTTVKKLRQFLGVVNYYRRFLPNAATKLQLLTDMTKGCTPNSKKPIVWTRNAETAFEDMKNGISQLTLLAHPAPDARTVLTTDASGTAVGAVLQQEVKGHLTPIAFFSKKLSDPQVRYSTYDRELLAIYLSIKHFSYFLDGRTFEVFTDHRPLTYALRKSTDTQSPRVSRQLAHISQYDCELKHISGDENVIADVLSRTVFSVSQKIQNVDYGAVASAQNSDTELETLLRPDAQHSLHFRPFKLDNSPTPLWCEVSAGTTRVYIPAAFRKEIFKKFHEPSHPGIRATQRLMVRRVVWPGIKKNVRDWTQTCLSCQKAKVCRHVKAPVGKLPMPKGRFSIVHVDVVGPLPPSREHRFLLTCIDRLTRWTEAIPMIDSTAETTARAFLSGWVSRFGSPHTVITDRGVQFESHLWKQMLQGLNTERNRTTAYHPQSNGMIERVHRRLKDGIKAQEHPSNWMDALPLILLYMHSTPSTDNAISPAELAYGEALRLPGEFQPSGSIGSTRETFLAALSHANTLAPQPTREVTKQPTYVPHSLQTATHVLIRTDAVKTGLQLPYLGPFKVIRRDNKVFTVDKSGREYTVSIDRLKPVHLPPLNPEEETIAPQSTTVVPENYEPVPFPILEPPAAAPQPTIPLSPQVYRTRAGREVRPPERLGGNVSS